MLEQGAGSRSALEIADAIEYLGADSHASQRLRLDGRAAARAGVATRRGAADDGRRRAAADVSERRARTPAAGAAHQPAAGARRPGDDRRASPSLASSSARRTATVPRRSGTAETIKAFTADDLRAFYASLPARQRGAARRRRRDRRTVLPLLETSFGAWKAAPGRSRRRSLPPVKQPAARTIYLVDKPGAAQSQIRIGWIGVPRSTPDYFPLRVLNTVLGGSFTSRLNTNLREKHGYTYGASSTFDMRAPRGRSSRRRACRPTRPSSRSRSSSTS